MADNTSNPINRTHLYAFRPDNGASNGLSLTTIPFGNSVPFAHQLTQAATQGMAGAPTWQWIPDGASAQAMLEGVLAPP